MTQKTSLIGGTISLSWVILLSWLSLDMVDRGTFFMLELACPGAEMPEGESATLESGKDSTETPAGKEHHR
jgi:hypothetical protein